MPAQLGTVSINEGRILKLWFEINQLRESTSISPDTSAPYAEDDKEGTAYITSSTGEQVTLIPVTTYALGDGAVSYLYESDNPTEIDVDPAGQVVFLVPVEQTSNAVITITGLQDGNTTARTVAITLNVSGPSVVDVIEGGVAGSARKALSDPMDTALSGANPLTQQDIFTSQDHTTPSYTRNTSFFLSSHVEALTCASPWNSVGGKNRAGTAITKRHAVLAAHYPYGAETTVRFVTSDNTIVTRTVVQASRVLHNGQDTDVWMVLFDSDLPASITPCKIFPSDFETYLPAGVASDSYAATDLPLLATDFEEKGIVLDVLTEGTGTRIDFFYGEPTLPNRSAFYDPIISGDSGNPVFAAIGSELWLLSTFYGSGTGPFYGGLVSELNAMIVTLDTLQGDLTGYTVTEGDLSSFTTYP